MAAPSLWPVEGPCLEALLPQTCIHTATGMLTASYCPLMVMCVPFSCLDFPQMLCTFDILPAENVHTSYKFAKHSTVVQVSLPKR